MTSNSFYKQDVFSYIYNVDNDFLDAYILEFQLQTDRRKQLSWFLCFQMWNQLNSQNEHFRRIHNGLLTLTERRMPRGLCIQY